jgi:hypothetical protein
MKSNRLCTLTLTLIVLVVASPVSDAWGAAKFKVLHRFYAGKNNNG